ncbi:hypothetical protein ES703_108579 [subsurface metagenome]
MITVKVKTIWQGWVGVRDRYIAEAKEAGEGLVILHNRESMTIPHDEIDKRVVAQSEKPFTDRFGRDPHFLIYFNWKPEVRQGSLSL